MTKTITKKKYYKITFDLASPLALGSGDNDNTDKDLILDSAGKPYIPASSIAGVVREYLETNNYKQTRKYLGYVDPATATTKADQSESCIIFYDATITSDTWHISVRDNVALDEYKTAKKGSKFDMEILEPGVSFVTYIEQDYTDGYNEDFGAEIVRALLNGAPVLGGKGMRGYGRLTNIQVVQKEFSFPDKIKEWLDFDLFTTLNWNSFEINTAADGLKEIKLALELVGGISIRRYTTRVSTDDKTEPDMEQLTLSDDSEFDKRTPVIPGTSWAGAIAHRMSEFGINTDKEGSNVEGDGKDAKARSKIVFGESQLKGGSFKTISRNAIDRFTGGTVDGALFTERTYYGGTTDLVIGWKSKDAIPEKEAKALAAALTDMHYGILAIGGETSIGRGIFRIKEIDGKNVPKDATKVYTTILSKIQEVFR